MHGGGLGRRRGLVAAADLVVDGIVGIGGSAGLRDRPRPAARRRSDDAPVVAVDVPSGVDAEPACCSDAAVRAD